MLAGEVDPRSSMHSVSSESSDLISWARLLERRVSFAPWAAVSCAVLSEPKNFMKLCATDAAGNRGASGLFAHCIVSRTACAENLAQEDRGQELLAVAGGRFHRHRGAAASSRRTCYCRCAGGRLGPIRLRHVFLDIYLALEVRALFDRNPL